MKMQTLAEVEQQQQILLEVLGLVVVRVDMADNQSVVEQQEHLELVGEVERQLLLM
jgi:hypothetical protein